METIDLDGLLGTGVGSDRDPNPSANPPSPNTPEGDSGNDPNKGEGNDPAPNPPTNNDTGEEDLNEVETNYQALFTSPSTKEDRTLRADIIKEFGGADLNDKGDLVDAEGKVIKSFKDLVKEIQEEAPALNLDKDGNEVDEKGNIIRTKEQIASESSLVYTLHQNSEYEFLDEEGNVKQYTDDEDGIKEFTDDVAKAKLETFKQTFFNANPELAKISQHLLSGGTLADFNAPKDYSNIDLKAMSDNDKLKLIRESFEISNTSETRINQLLTMIKDSNNVDAEVKEAVAALQTHQDTLEQAREAKYEASIEKQNKEMEAHWEQVQNTVSKGDLGNVSIPESDRDSFFDYLSTVVDDAGNSKDMLDTKKETMEQKLAFAYMRFKGYDLSKLVSSKAKTMMTQSLRDRLRRSGRFNSTPANNAASNARTGDVNITIDTLL